MGTMTPGRSRCFFIWLSIIVVVAAMLNCGVGLCSRCMEKTSDIHQNNKHLSGKEDRREKSWSGIRFQFDTLNNCQKLFSMTFEYTNRSFHNIFRFLSNQNYLLCYFSATSALVWATNFQPHVYYLLQMARDIDWMASKLPGHGMVLIRVYTETLTWRSSLLAHREYH